MSQQLLVASLRKLERGRLRRDAVELCGPARPRAAAAAAPLERDVEKAGPVIKAMRLTTDFPLAVTA